MGVPRLALYIKENFPSAIQQIPDPHNDDNPKVVSPVLIVDNIYFDLNAILHPCAQIAFDYGQSSRIIKSKVKKTFQEKMIYSFQLVWQVVKKNINLITPTKLIYIALDGPAPISKMNQQRQRRFLSGKTRIESLTQNEFDSNCMTPGTIFMVELSKFINTHIRLELNNPKSNWYGKQVVFSPTSVPGEGEHKLLDHIRSDKSSFKESHCIVGPDGDLIMLALASHLTKMYLFRPTFGQDGFYDLIDVGKIRFQLPKPMGMLRQVALKKRTHDEFANDFILLGFFVGNDFLPKIQMFDILEQGIEFMTYTYKQISTSQEIPLTLLEPPYINYSFFTQFIEKISMQEHLYLAEQARHGQKLNNFTLLAHTKQATKPQPKIYGVKRSQDDHRQFVIDFDNYRNAYYAKMGINSRDEIDQMCESYIHTMVWIYIYYIYGIPSWKTSYNYHYAPLMIDLHNFLLNSQDKWTSICHFEKDKPILPFVQLLAVLPPTSFHLLPKPFHPLMTDPNSALVTSGMYNMDFQLDKEGKHAAHHYLVLVSFCDIKFVEKEYKKIQERNDYFRNKFGRVVRFQHDNHKMVKYISDYGNIEKCSVSKTEL